MTIDVPSVAPEEASVEADTHTTPALASPPVEAEKPSIEDMAAHDYKFLRPELYKMLDTMPKKQLLRVVKAMVDFPLEDSKPKFSYEAEKNAFYLAVNILDCKFVIMKAVLELTKNKDAIAAFTKEMAIKQEERKNERK